MSINMEILSYKSTRRQIFAVLFPKRNSYTINLPLSSILSPVGRGKGEGKKEIPILLDQER
jgi:hypothetical protein